MSEATSAAPLTVVLVHGAFADSSSWDGVIERLQAAGLQVTAAPNPLRGISHDSAYVASFMKQVHGPVLAVGHSYGGAVISNAATGLGNVVGLVFVAAFAPDEDERLGEVAAGSRDSVLGRRRSRCSTRLRRARRRPLSSRSIPRSFMTRSPPTCRRSRPP
jgi:pimeloyl-ACP methyl ester carboxylesterase